MDGISIYPESEAKGTEKHGWYLMKKIGSGGRGKNYQVYKEIYGK